MKGMPALCPYTCALPLYVFELDIELDTGNIYLRQHFVELQHTQCACL